MIIKCLVVDDNIADLEMTCTVVESYFNNETDYAIEISTLSDAHLIDYTDKNDICILDIDMPEIDGFTIAAQIYQHYPNSVIVFCSSHDDLVFDSFRFNAFYFVRKSFLKEDMSIALNKFTDNYTKLNVHYLYSFNNKLQSIPVSEIIYFETYHNDLLIHLKDGTTLKERKPLKSVIQDIDSPLLIQCGKSYLINAAQIKEISTSTVTLNDGTLITIPRRKTEEFKNAYLEYLMKQT